MATKTDRPVTFTAAELDALCTLIRTAKQQNNVALKPSSAIGHAMQMAIAKIGVAAGDPTLIARVYPSE
jgi:hypothetical protein